MAILYGIFGIAGVATVYLEILPPIVAALCATVLPFILSTVYQLVFSPLAKYPGPRLWAISRLPWAWHVVRGDLWQTFEDMHRKYGPWIRIAPNELSTTAPEAWKELYASNPLPIKDPNSSTPPPNGIHSLFTAGGQTHRRLRGIFVNGFSSKALRGQSPILEEYANQFIERVGREVSKSATLDIAKLYGYVAFDIITDLTYGESIHGLEGDSSHSWIERYYIQSKVATFRNLVSHFPPLDWLFDAVLGRLTADKRMQNFREVGRKLDRRLQLDEKAHGREDLLSPVMGRVSEQPGRDQITKDELIVHGFSTVVVNSQAVTVVLASMTQLLLTNPRAIDRLVAEIDGKNFKLAREDINVESTTDMVYLDAVINETLRIHHPTPMSLPRVMPEGGKFVAGHHLPAKSIVGINLQNIQNAPDNWVLPEAFYPERFLDETHPYFDSRFQQDKKEAFHPFSIGPRNCLGGRLFLAQVRVILVRLLHLYQLALADNRTPHDLWKRPSYFVFEPRELHIKLHKRPDRF
ncbi:Cytochrome P450 [Trichoderma simmonsii]|uniref:Cytochrome P450 n=1 Tax=Trichoderma simmonsii TaxID=1491479 RepID=A0A8G0L1W6_9HYPO|nr:Cytochrome P450 [Trichoderma simmonsii]